MQKISFSLPEVIDKKKQVKELVKIWLEDVQGIHPALWKTSQKKELQKRFNMPKMMSRAKKLLEDCAGNFADAHWSLKNKKYYL